jgi:hypothetical protein
MERESQEFRRFLLGLAGLILIVVCALLAERAWGLRAQDSVLGATVAASYGRLGWTLGCWLWCRHQLGTLLLDLGPRDERSLRWVLGQAGAMVLLGLLGLAGLLVTHNVFFGVTCLVGCPGIGLQALFLTRSRKQIRDGGIVVFPDVVLWSAIVAYEVRTWAVTLQVRSWGGLLLSGWRLAVLPEQRDALEQLLAQHVAGGPERAGWLPPRR